MAAAGSGLTVEIDYRSRSRGEQSWRRVDPYAVAAREGQYWELHGWCHRNQEIRTFALDQVRGMRLTEERFALRGEEWRAFAGAKGVIGGRTERNCHYSERCVLGGSRGLCGRPAVAGRIDLDSAGEWHDALDRAGAGNGRNCAGAAALATALPGRGGRRAKGADS